MANHARGEAEVVLGGRPFTLVLGMGVLAEIEDAFGGESYEEVFEQVFGGGEKMSASRIARYLRALLKGNGVPVDDEASVAAIAAATPRDVYAAQRELMRRAGMIAETPAAEEGGYRSPPSAGEPDGISGSASASATSG